MERISLKSVGAYARQNNIIEDFLYLELVDHNHKAAFVLRYLVAQTGLDRSTGNANFAFYLFRENVASLFNMSASTFDRMRSSFKTIGVIFNNGVVPGTNTQCLWVHFDRTVFWEASENAVESLSANLQIVKMNRHRSSKCVDTDRQNDERNELPSLTPLSSPDDSDIQELEGHAPEIIEREIFEFPSDLSGLKFYEQQIGESIEPFVDQLRDEIKRLGELRVIAKAKDCTNGESWQYLLKSLRKLNENEPEPEKKSSKVVQVEQWQPSEYSHKGDPAEEQRESFAAEHFNGDDSGETIASSLNDISPEIQRAFDLAKHQLSLQFDAGTYMYFMRDMIVMDYCPESQTITIEAPHERTKEYTRNIRRVISDVLNQAIELVFTSGSGELRLPTYEGLKTGHVSACPA